MSYYDVDAILTDAQVSSPRESHVMSIVRTRRLLFTAAAPRNYRVRSRSTFRSWDTSMAAPEKMYVNKN